MTHSQSETINILASVHIGPVDYSVCCRSKYLIISWHPHLSVEFPADQIPDNDYASLPIACLCKDVDLTFDKFAVDSFKLLELEQIENLKSMHELKVTLRFLSCVL